MSRPDLYLKTGFILNGQGRITSTREPAATRGPLFTLVRGVSSCVWAIRVDVPTELAHELDGYASEEPPTLDLRGDPVHAERYIAAVERWGGAGNEGVVKIRQSAGPAFTFPNALAPSGDIVTIDDEKLLQRHFRGWVPGEIAAGRSPVIAVVENGYPVSVCFCARRSGVAAEAGLETAEAYRGRGYGARVTEAWALAILASGRVPLYSTSWTNTASLAVARRLGLITYASYWSLYD